MCGAKPGYVGSLPPRRRLVFGVRSAETALAHLDGTQAPLRNSGGRTSVAVLLAPLRPLASSSSGTALSNGMGERTRPRPDPGLQHRAQVRRRDRCLRLRRVCVAPPRCSSDGKPWAWKGWARGDSMRQQAATAPDRRGELTALPAVVPRCSGLPAQHVSQHARKTSARDVTGPASAPVHARNRTEGDTRTGGAKA